MINIIEFYKRDVATVEVLKNDIFHLVLAYIYLWCNNIGDKLEITGRKYIELL